MPTNVPVFYIVGTDPKANVTTELAKFFSRKHAENHLDMYAGWYHLHIDERQESIEAQHEAHREGPEGLLAAAKRQAEARSRADDTAKRLATPLKNPPRTK